MDAIPFLSELPDDDKELVQHAFIEKKVKKGTILFDEYNPAEAIYFIRKGKVRLSKSTPEGKELVLNIWAEGHFIGQASLFRTTYYPATAEMLEDGELVIIRNQDLETMIRKYPQIGISIIQILGERLCKAHAKLRDITLYGKLGALASLLIRLAGEYGKPTTQGIEIGLFLTHQELANFIGAARENVNRMMSTLEKSDVLTMKRGKITIKNLEELQNYLL